MPKSTSDTEKAKQSSEGLMRSTAKEERDIEASKGTPLKKGAARFEERSKSSDGRSAEEKQTKSR